MEWSARFGFVWIVVVGPFQKQYSPNIIPLLSVDEECAELSLSREAVMYLIIPHSTNKQTNSKINSNYLVLSPHKAFTSPIRNDAQDENIPADFEQINHRQIAFNGEDTSYRSTSTKHIFTY